MKAPKKKIKKVAIKNSEGKIIRWLTFYWCGVLETWVTIPKMFEEIVKIKPLNKEKLDKMVFISELIDEFKMFVAGAMRDNVDEDFEDHFGFLKALLEVFEDLKSE